jgi:hypothetical protein
MALVGEASSGKSTVLTAIWTLLEAAAPPPTIEDISRATEGRIHLEAELERGSISSTPGRRTRSTSTGPARPPCSSCRPTCARARWSHRRLGRAPPTSPSSGVRLWPTITGRPRTVASRSFAEADKEGILVLECGGKGNIPLFARICNHCGIPYVVVHDRDAPDGERPVESERVVNRQIQEVAGWRRTVVLVPNFEAVSGMNSRRRGGKPRKAYHRFSGNGDVPPPLKQAVEKVLRAARA